MFRYLLAALGGLAAASGCTNSSCVPAPVLQVRVTEFDRVDGGGVPVYVPSTSASVVVSADGGEPYECYQKDPGVYQCAGSTAGTYEVTVTLDGEQQSQTATFDEADECGVVEPQELRFQLGGPPDADAGT